MPRIGIGTDIAARHGGISWQAYWATLISATVENAAPTHVALTFPSPASTVATDITATVNGAARVVSSASWTGSVWTVVLASAVVYGDVVVMTFVPSGGTANVTNNTIEAETTTLVGRFTTPAADARKVLINAAIKKMKTDGVFARLDVLCLIGHDAQCSLQNWIQNVHNATAVNSPVFVSDRYFQGDGISMYIETNFKADGVGTLFQRNTASFGIYRIAYRTSGAAYDGDDAAALISNAASGTPCRLNSGTFVDNNGTLGLKLAVREDANTVKTYTNGTINTTDAANASGALVANNKVHLFSYQNLFGGFNNGKIAGWFLGQSLTGTDVANLTTAIETYMDAIGAGIIP